MRKNGKIVLLIKWELKIKKSKFHKTKGELRKLAKENNIKLLKLLKHLRKRSNKKIRGKKWDKVGNGLN